MTVGHRPDLETGGSLHSVALPVPSAQDIAEASAVTAQSSGHQFEIQLGHLCNNRCVFCSSGQLTEMKLARPVPFEPIMKAISEARAAGAARLIFLGGEPTLHKRFVEVLAESKKLGFEEIVIFTNGVRLPTKGFVESIVALGDFTWRISIQGGNEAAHVAVTKRGRSFQRIVAGIAKLQELGQRVTTNMCVNEESYRSLPDFPELIETYGIAQLHVDIVRPASTGMRTTEYLREIMPKYSEMAPYYRAMLEGFDAQDPHFDVNVGNLPYCILPDWGHRIHHAGDNTVTQSAGANGLENVDDKYAVHKSQRTQTERCVQCVFQTRCTGIFRDYIGLYGDDEFQPVTLEHLASIDGEQHNFDLLLEPFIATLANAAPPLHWRPAQVWRDSRNRKVDVHLAHTERGAITLHFVPASGDVPLASEAIFATDRYRLGLTVEGWLQDDVLVSVVQWATSLLSATNGVLVTQPLDIELAKRQRGESELLNRARTRMVKMVRRLQRHQRFGTWFFGGATMAPGGNATRVRVHGPEGYHVDLHIEIGATDGRNQVSARFELGPQTKDIVARPIIEEMVTVMKGRPKK